MMILLKHPDTGEMQCVNTPDGWDFDLHALGYDGWEALHERDTPPPENADFDEKLGDFVVDAQRKAAADEEARLAGLSRAELMAEAVETAKQQIAEGILVAGSVQAFAAALATPSLEI